LAVAPLVALPTPEKNSALIWEDFHCYLGQKVVKHDFLLRRQKGTKVNFLCAFVANFINSRKSTVLSHIPICQFERSREQLMHLDCAQCDKNTFLIY
jgi:hypothetical protein